MQETRECGSLDGQVPWRRKWQPTPVFWPGKSHGQRSLVPWTESYIPKGHKGSYATEPSTQLSTGAEKNSATLGLYQNKNSQSTSPISLGQKLLIFQCVSYAFLPQACRSSQLESHQCNLPESSLIFTFPGREHLPSIGEVLGLSSILLCNILFMKFIS